MRKTVAGLEKELMYLARIPELSLVDLKPIIDDLLLKKDCKILNLGCGNSEFCENMYDDGYINIDNNDICENVIKFMKERNINRKGLKCK